MSGEQVWDVPHEARAFQGRHAGLVSRLVAACIDAVVVAVLLLAGYAAAAALRFAVDPRHFQFPPTSLLLSLAAALVVLVSYLTVAWSLTGRTYGCHVMGLRVVTASAGRVQPLRALVRAICCSLLPLGLLWCAVSRDNLSLQDIVLRTSVIYDWRIAPAPGAQTSR